MAKTNELVPVKGQSRKGSVATDAPPVQYHSVADIREMAKAVATSRLFGLTESEAFTLIMLADSDGHKIKRILNFLVKIQPDASGCWIWQGATIDTGYGKFSMGDRSRAGNRFPDGAHRASYRLFVGLIPEEFELDHLCRNRSCVHPFHLEPITHHENLMRGDTIAARYAAQTHCKHGHPKTPENTYFYKGKAHGCLICMQLRDKARPPRRERTK